MTDIDDLQAVLPSDLSDEMKARVARAVMANGYRRVTLAETPTPPAEDPIRARIRELIADAQELPPHSMILARSVLLRLSEALTIPNPR